MRFQIISPLLGAVESYRLASDAVESLNASFDTSGGLSDRYILDTQTGRPLTRKQVDKWNRFTT